jgi:O-antigen/teichoic acid export membrane protein
VADPGSGEAQRAGERAVKNTAVRAVAEIVGKLASLVVFAFLARAVGPSGLGTFVLALAWAQIPIAPVGLGIDRYLLRRVAKDRSVLGDFLFNALALKLSRSIPVIAASLLVLTLVDYDAETRQAVYILTAGVLLDSLARTLTSVFNAFERGALVATTIVAQRLVAAALGLAALAAGFGVLAVCVTFSIGAAVRLALSLALMKRDIGIPAASFPAAARRELRSRSAPFAVQDIFGLVLAKVDVVILSFLASDAAVGVYGAAYRLFEATSFLSSSLLGAFSAQYTYLGPDTRPTVGGVFQRSLKLSLSLLVPCAVAFAVLASPLCRMFFGAELEAAADPLRILAPVVVLFGLVVLSTSLIVSRRNPMTIVVTVGAIALLNVALNLALIPSYEETGAATAMLISEVVFACVLLTIAIRTVGGIDWRQTLAAPVTGGAAMAAAMAPLHDLLAAAVAAGSVAYLGVYVFVERLVSPGDLDFAVRMLRGRLPRWIGRSAGPGPRGAPAAEATPHGPDSPGDSRDDAAPEERAGIAPGERRVRLRGEREGEPPR